MQRLKIEGISLKMNDVRLRSKGYSKSECFLDECNSSHAN